MNENRIAEIRKRHAFADEHKSVIRPSGFSWTIPGWQAHNDRTFLLFEVERLQGMLKCLSRDMAEEIEKLTRERDDARAALQPFAAEAHSYDPDDGDDLHPAWDLPFQIKHLRAARKALEAKP